MKLDVFKYLRRLAKNTYYQSLYSLGKELSYLRIFDNDKDFTDIQINFLKYLNFYASIYMDIALGDVDEIVLENEIYEDSYAFWKNKKDKTKYTDLNKPQNNDFISSPKSRWIFKNPKTKEKL